MNNIRFEELKARITISEIAERLGYKLNSKAGNRFLEYKLYSGSQKTDEIVIYTNRITQTFFSRNGIGDKGDLINFVLNRLHMFGSYSGTSYEAVSDILTRYLGLPSTIEKKKQVVLPRPVSAFSLEDYDISYKQNVIYAYLGKTRRIAADVISAFLSIGAVCTVSKKNQPYNYVNVAFPFRVLSNPAEIVNFELRNYNPFKQQSYKGFCEGGNKSTACWIASFAKDWNQVSNLYIGESALDMMALYQLLSVEERQNSAFISVGGNLGFGQISDVKKYFPNAVVHLAFDNDVQGNIYDIQAAYCLLYGQNIKIYKKNEEIILVNNSLQIKVNEKEFNSLTYLICNNMYPDWIHIKKAYGAKDFNDMLD